MTDIYWYSFQYCWNTNVTIDVTDFYKGFIKETRGTIINLNFIKFLWTSGNHYFLDKIYFESIMSSIRVFIIDYEYLFIIRPKIGNKEKR